MYRIEFKLDGLPPTPNRRGHWAKQHKLNQAWKQKTAMEIVLHGRPLRQLDKIHVVFTRYSASQCDQDNLSASFKYVQDGIVAAGVIPDDSPEHITTEHHQEKAKRGQGHITVLIEEVA